MYFAKDKIKFSPNGYDVVEFDKDEDITGLDDAAIERLLEKGMIAKRRAPKKTKPAKGPSVFKKEPEATEADDSDDSDDTENSAE